MVPQDILDAIPGLTRDKLSYYERMGYIKPKKSKRGTLHYASYSEKDLLLIERAYYYINGFGSRPSIAFEKAQGEVNQPSLNLKRK